MILSNRLVYISILSLPRFFLIIRYILSYYSAFSLFTMFYSILFSMILSSFGGGKENRTPDPLLAKQMLSQLSYTPNCLVGLGRLELPTSRLSGVRSNHLSYKPMQGLPPLILLKRICRRYIFLFHSLKGGDPAAGSPTATLLRLRPSR